MRKICSQFAVLLAAIALLSSAPSARADDPPIIVSIETPLGSFEVELLPEAAPRTVDNFLDYLDDGDYENSFIHRSVPGFVVQGGGFVYENGAPAAIPTDPPIPNEFKLSNRRGTMAMAKVSGNPDSATSQWFINLADNSSTLDASNGGFTVFGRVLGDGMRVVDALAAVPLYNAGGSFQELPLLDYTVGDAITVDNLLTTAIRRTTSAMPDLLLRRSTNQSWIGYRYAVDGKQAVIEDKGRPRLSRSEAFETASRGDFDGDGARDILLRDTTLARAGGWHLATLLGGRITAEADVALPEGAEWKLVATADFDGDGRDDVLLRDTDDGTWRVYRMDGTEVLESGAPRLSDDLDDAFAAVGDLDGDGSADILLRRANGTWLGYLMDGVQVDKSGRPKLDRDGDVQLASLADFDGDGTADALMRAGDGDWELFELDGLKARSRGAVELATEPTTLPVAFDDFDGNGTADVLLRDADGAWELYLLDGRDVVLQGPLDIPDDLDYGVVLHEDMNNDGRADLLLRHTKGSWLAVTVDGSVPAVLETVVPRFARNRKWVPQLD